MATIANKSNTAQWGVAYPTILLTVFAISIYVTVSISALTGALSIGWAIGINSFMAYLLFTSMHEAGHLNISGSNKSLRWAEEGIGWLSGLTLFAPYYVFKVLHFRHHAFTNDPEKDPDHWLASKNPLALLMHSTTIFPVYFIKALQLLFFTEERISKKIKRELQIGLLIFIVMVSVFILAGLTVGWLPIVQVWLIPAFIAQALLAFAFDWLPHHPHKEKGRYQNTRVVDIPGLSLLLLGQNYHLVHHLHPRIPFYEYEKSYRNMEEKVKSKGVEIISISGTSASAQTA
jgi:fatty acid desaturase